MNYNSFPIAIGVDIQNDFCPGGALPVTDGDTIVAPFNALAERVRNAGGKAIFTRDWHPTQTTHFNDWPVHCVAKTNGGSFHPALTVKSDDTVLSKGTKIDEDAYSGFQGSSDNGDTLSSIITAELSRVERVALYIGGLATDYCVKATVVDALALQQRIGSDRLAVFALADCMKAVNIGAEDGDEAIEIMKAHGAIFIESTEVQL